MTAHHEALKSSRRAAEDLAVTSAVPTPGQTTGRRLPAAFGAVTLALVLAGCTVPSAGDDAAAAPAQTPSPSSSTVQPSAEPSTAPSPEPATGQATEPAAGTALAQLGTLAVKGRAPKTGYDRDQFGEGWVDTDRNGCDSRNDVLTRDLTGVGYKPGTRDCVVLTGTLADPYSGTTIAFVRGEDTSNAVQIDHVVALSNAWQTGAQQWDTATRTAFANDSLELLAVDGPLNGQKGDGDAATWLPPNTGFRCAYVARQVAVKAAYGLWVTPPERDAIAGVLAACPDEPVPTAAAFRKGPSTSAAPVPVSPEAAAPKPAAPEPAAPVVADGTDPRFDTCKAAKAAGFGNYVSGVDPEYDWYRDADGDGTVCE